MTHLEVGDTVVAIMSVDHCLSKDKAYVVIGTYNGQAWVNVQDDRGVVGSYRATNFRGLKSGEDPVYETAMRQMQLNQEQYDQMMLEQEIFERISSGAGS